MYGCTYRAQRAPLSRHVSLPPLRGFSGSIFWWPDLLSKWLYPLKHLSSPKYMINKTKQNATQHHNMNSLNVNKTLRRRPDVNPKHCQLFYWELKNKTKQTKNTTSLVSCRDWHAETAFQQQRLRAQWERACLARGPGSIQKHGAGEQDPSRVLYHRYSVSKSTPTGRPQSHPPPARLLQSSFQTVRLAT